MSAALVGAPMPRIYTRPLRPGPDGLPLPEDCLGPQLEAYADALGVALLPWQRSYLWLSTELVGGRFRYRTIVLEVARQNGKSLVLGLRSGYSAIVRGENVLACAQDLSTATQLWKESLAEIEAGDLAAYVDTVRYTNGQQRADLVGGGSWSVTAATASAGRGRRKTGLLTIDEARELRDYGAWDALVPTTLAAADPQTILTSNAGSDASVVLRAQRQLAVDRIDDPATTIAIYSWSAPDGCQLTDPAALVQANPAIGHTLTLDHLRQLATSTPENSFRTEHLCQWVRVDRLAVPLSAWAACASDSAVIDPSRPQYWGVDVAIDGQSCTLVAAQPDPATGRAVVQVLQQWTGDGAATAAAAALPTLVIKHKPAGLAWQGSAAATVLSPQLRKLTRYTRPREVRGVDVAAICTRLVERVTGQQLLHSSQPLLDRAVEVAEPLHRGDLIVFTRSRGGASVDALYAAALAVDLVALAPPARTVKLIRPTRGGTT